MRAPGGKMGKDSFSYNQKLFSAHEQLPELCPGDNSNSEETNAAIIETSPGKSYCSGCLKLGQTEQWQQHNRKWMAERFLSLQLLRDFTVVNREVERPTALQTGCEAF